MWNFCFESIEWRDLVHDSVPVIVSGFTSLIEDFVIRCYQVTKLFCSKYCFARASSVRSPCYCGSQTDIAFSVLSGSVYNYCASSIMKRFLEYVQNPSRENYVRVQATLRPQDYLWNPSTRNGRSANGSFASFLSSLRDSCTSLLGAGSSLHSKTESEDELDAALFLEAKCASGSNDSCGSVAEDELFPELTDKPGKTRGTKLSVLQKIRFPFLGQSWLLTADPLVRASVLNRQRMLAHLVSSKW